ncbi:putative lipoprotein [Methylococcus capsulatus str. Bath]|uniref:Putative lipoprotein n=2 Tax=Methylococcus capsulatus TaxID=414 RepID=Q604M9_METCA|nr:putative lipoprotein [Methylococcus capsulatus str. Bath]
MRSTAGFPLGASLLMAACQAAGAGGIEGMAGAWTSLSLLGSLGSVSPDWRKFKWYVRDQVRLRDDNPPNAWRMYEDLLWVGVGYQVDPRFYLGIGYAHTWLHPVDQPAYQENRPYLEAVLTHEAVGGKLVSRTRLEERVLQQGGEVGIRFREAVTWSHPVRFVAEGAEFYMGDELMVCSNYSLFGPAGFCQNRILSGISYRLSRNLGVDFGYLGQYMAGTPGTADVWTHNIQFDLHYVFLDD